MSSLAEIRPGIFGSGPFRGLAKWLDAMPHPTTVLEIAPTHVSAARWGRGEKGVEALAVEALPSGALTPSAVETNVRDAEAIGSALRGVIAGLAAQGRELSLLLPDPVVRVFILPFDNFPRRAEEALPLLRWRLKKSLPFDVEETVISWTRQAGRDGKTEIIAPVARQRILREYESIIEAAGMVPGVVLASTLAVLPLLEDSDATLLARLSGTSLTTAIVQGSRLCVYRSTEMGAGAARLEAKAILEEIFPSVAFYQDTWGGVVERVRLCGFRGREDELGRALSSELGCPAERLSVPRGIFESARKLMEQGHEALVGWHMNCGA